MPTHFLWFLFDWRGRIGRSPYRISILVLALFVASLKLAPQQLHGLLVGALAAQLVVQAALDAKRLHDIGLSAVWVPFSSLLCIAVMAALGALAPDMLATAMTQIGDTLGPAPRDGGTLAIVTTGLSTAAVLRTSLLWQPKSNKAGDVYDFAPGAGGKVVRMEKAGAADAEALIARALAEQKEREARASELAALRGAPSQTSRGARKSFGVRKSA